MAAQTVPPQAEEAPAINEDEFLEGYLDLEDQEPAWLGYADPAQVQAELAMALDVTGSA